MFGDILVTDPSIFSSVTFPVTYNKSHPNFHIKDAEYTSIILEGHTCCEPLTYKKNKVFVWCGNTSCAKPTLNKVPINYVLKSSYKDYETLEYYEDKKIISDPYIRTSYNPCAYLYKSTNLDPVITHKVLCEKTNDMSIFTKDDIPYFKDVTIEDHSCVVIVGNGIRRDIKWCGTNPCKSVIAYQNMRKRQQKEDNAVRELLEQGHTCVRNMESYPSQHSWCQQEICINFSKN